MATDSVIEIYKEKTFPVDVDISGLHLATFTYGTHSIIIYRDTYDDYDGEWDGNPPNIQPALNAVKSELAKRR